MCLVGEHSLNREYAVVCCDLHRRVSKGHAYSVNGTHTVTPREHYILGLRLCRNQGIPPQRQEFLYILRRVRPRAPGSRLGLEVVLCRPAKTARAWCITRVTIDISEKEVGRKWQTISVRLVSVGRSLNRSPLYLIIYILPPPTCTPQMADG